MSPSRSRRAATPRDLPRVPPDVLRRIADVTDSRTLARMAAASTNLRAVASNRRASIFGAKPLRDLLEFAFLTAVTYLRRRDDDGPARAAAEHRQWLAAEWRDEVSVQHRDTAARKTTLVHSLGDGWTATVSVPRNSATMTIRGTNGASGVDCTVNSFARRFSFAVTYGNRTFAGIVTHVPGSPPPSPGSDGDDDDDRPDEADTWRFDALSGGAVVMHDVPVIGRVGNVDPRVDRALLDAVRNALNGLIT